MTTDRNAAPRLAPPPRPADEAAGRLLDGLLIAAYQSGHAAALQRGLSYAAAHEAGTKSLAAAASGLTGLDLKPPHAARENVAG